MPRKGPGKTPANQKGDNPDATVLLRALELDLDPDPDLDLGLDPDLDPDPDPNRGPNLVLL